MRFSLTQVAFLLGKSPVTMRYWERMRFYKFPRPDGINRVLTPQQVQDLASHAYSHGRLTDERYEAVVNIMNDLSVLVENKPVVSTAR